MSNSIDWITILISLSSYILLLLFALIRLYFNKRLVKHTDYGLIIPAGCGKSFLIDTIRKSYTENCNVYCIDIEEKVYNSIEITTEQKKQLDDAKLTDSIFYEHLMMSYTLQIYSTFRKTIASTNPSFKVIVAGSSLNIIKNLGINNYYSFQPTNKLLKILNIIENTSPLYLKYTMNLLKGVPNKDLHTFNDFDDLFQKVSTILKLKKTSSNHLSIVLNPV